MIDLNNRYEFLSIPWIKRGKIVDCWWFSERALGVSHDGHASVSSTTLRATGKTFSTSAHLSIRMNPLLKHLASISAVVDISFGYFGQSNDC